MLYNVVLVSAVQQSDGTFLNAFVISNPPPLLCNLFFLEFFCSSSISRIICEIGRNIGEFTGRLLLNVVTNNIKAHPTMKYS